MRHFKELIEKLNLKINLLQCRNVEIQEAFFHIIQFHELFEGPCTLYIISSRKNK